MIKRMERMKKTKVKDALKRQLREQWEKACNGYLCELLRMWELDGFYGYWVGDEVGGVYDYGDGRFTIGMDDMIYIVEHDVSEEQYTEWTEYCCDASEFGLATPNLKSFLKGCPRTDEATFKRLRKLKNELQELAKKELDKAEQPKGMEWA